ncbi:MAG: zinc ABC transporter substrate-binding protein [Gudongella sp.]|nr:zinc ABC transporter substrate-binding protein [Gudongella sp.]
MKSRKLSIILIFMLVVSSMFGCAPEKNNLTENSEPVENVVVEKDKLEIVTTLFPQYYFSKAIGGEFVNVDLLLPPGTEAHSFEPTPKDMVELLNADVFFFTGKDMEPWVINIASNLEDEDIKVVDLSENIVLIPTTDHEHEEDEHEEDSEGAMDPHYWTDPNMAMIMVDSILDALVEIDVEHEAYYVENAVKIKSQLADLDTEIREVLAKTESKTILAGGHFAFGYFAKQYGLEHLSPYAGFSPNAEPTPQRITELIKTINETGAKAIFYEELVDPKVAKLISEETGAQMLLLHGTHNVSKEDLESGKTYFDFMYENLENLKVGLNYND